MSTAQPTGEPLERALAAYYRTYGPEAAIPANTSDYEELDGREYVVLRNVNGVLAVYRIKSNGALVRLNEWPEELEEW